MNRRLIAVAVAPLAVLALVACSTATDIKPVARNTPSASAIASATSAPTSPKPSSSPAPDAPAGAVDGLAVVTRMVDAMIASKTAHTTVTSLGTLVSEGDYEFGKPAKAAMKLSQQGLNLEVIQVGGVIYIKGIPGLPKPWLKYNPKGTDAFSKALSSVGDLTKGQDPRTMATMMRGVKGRDMGNEQVGGVLTRHYAFVVPISAYGVVFSPQFLKAMQALTNKPIAMDYWIGGDDLPRKISTVITLSGSNAGKEQETEATYSDWGKRVSIVAPPAAQINIVPGS